MPEFLSSIYRVEEGNNKNISKYPVELFKDLIREKVLKKVNVDERTFKVVESKALPEPGFVDADESDLDQTETCLLCCQMARYAIGCSRCQSAYCADCAYYLCMLRKAHLKTPIATNKAELIRNKENFICLCPQCPFELNPVYLTKLPDLTRETLKTRRAKCIYANCQFVGPYIETCQHTSSCNRKGDFRINTEYLGTLFTEQAEPLYPEEYSTTHLINILKTKDPILLRRNQLIAEYSNQYEYSIREIAEIYTAIDEERAEYNLKRSVSSSAVEPPTKRSTPAPPTQSIPSTRNAEPQPSTSKSSFTNIQPKSTSSSTNFDPQSNWSEAEKVQYQKDLLSAQQSNQAFIAEKNRRKREKEKARKQRQREATKSSVSSSQQQPSSTQQPQSIQQQPSIPPLSKSTTSIHRSSSTISKSSTLSLSKSKSHISDRPPQATGPVIPNIEIIPYVPPPSTPPRKDKPVEKIVWDNPQSPKKIDLNPETRDVSDPRGYEPATQPCPQPKTMQDFSTAKAAKNWRYRQNNMKRFHQGRYSRRNHAYTKIKCATSLKSLKHMLPPKHLIDTIVEASDQLFNQGIKICAIDTESVQVRMKNGRIKQVPCWISIVDGTGVVVFNEFAKHGKTAIANFNTRFHGLTWEHIKNAPTFKQVRAEAITILRRYDRIIVSDQTSDFVSLFISPSDHIELLPKIICVSSYYSCRANLYETLGLKYITFLLFGELIQSREHSPIIDAAYTMYCYLLDYTRIELVREENIEHFNGTRHNNGYLQYIYPKNNQMATLLTAVMEEIEDWPYALKVHPYMSKAEKEEAVMLTKYHPSNFITPLYGIDSLRFPYLFDRERFRPFRRQSTR